MDLRRLRLFLAVVDEGTFTAAATAEHVSQPAVSLAVQELEAEVGAQLLVRSRHGARLTPAGEALEGPARQALRELEHATEAVAAVTGLVSGRLDLSALPTLAAAPVAGLVGAFRTAHPGVVVRLAAPTDLGEIAADVVEGRAEVGITEHSPANAGLEQITLRRQRLLAVGPPKGPTTTMRLDRLGATPLVLTPKGSSLRDLVGGALQAAGVEPEVGVETAQREALIPLVLAGAGTTFLPTELANAAGRLGATVRHTSPPLGRTIVAVHRAGSVGPAAARFLELATAT